MVGERNCGMGEAVTQFTVGPWNGVYWYTWENLQLLWQQYSS